MGGFFLTYGPIYYDFTLFFKQMEAPPAGIQSKSVAKVRFSARFWSPRVTQHVIHEAATFIRILFVRAGHGGVYLVVQAEFIPHIQLNDSLTGNSGYATLCQAVIISSKHLQQFHKDFRTAGAFVETRFMDGAVRSITNITGAKTTFYRLF